MPIDFQNLPGTGNNADHRVYSNFFDDNHIIQNVSIVQPKNLLIDTMRMHFGRDNVFTYRADEYGFPATPNLTGLTIDDPSTTKILISDVFRYEVKFFPAITVKSGGGKYTPISFNQNSTIKYRKDIVTDDFGTSRVIRTPTHRVFAGAWDMSFDISIYSESHSELEEITEIVKMMLQYVSFNELRANGLFIKSLSLSGETSEAYANDHVYSNTITINTRSEWRVEMPIENIVEKIVFYFDIKRHYIEGEYTEDETIDLSDLIEFAEITLT